MKRCSKCHELKPETEFYKDKRTRDGLKCQCKKCHCQTTIATRNEDSHRESNKQYMRRLSQKSPDKVREQWRKRKKTDPQKAKAREILNGAVRSGKFSARMLAKSVEQKAGHMPTMKTIQSRWTSGGYAASVMEENTESLKQRNSAKRRQQNVKVQNQEKRIPPRKG